MLRFLSLEKILTLLLKHCRRLTVVFALTVVVTGCVSAPTGQLVAANESLVASTGANDEECIMLKLTGTNIPKKYCSSKATWLALSKKDREIAKEYSRQMSERSGIQEQVIGGSAF